MLTRNLSRAVQRAARPAGRRLFTVEAEHSGSKYLAEEAAGQEHARHSTDLWRKISFYVAFPATLLTIAWVLKVEGEHAAHQEHVKHENGGELPETPAYSYLNMRRKPFPWGNNTLFYNPEVNKDMNEA